MKRLIDIIQFPTDWERTKVSAIGKVFKGKGIAKTEVTETGLPCIRYGEIYTVYNYKVKDTRSFVSKESAAFSQPIQFGDVLFAGSGETSKEIGKAVTYIGNETAYAGGDIVILRSKKALSGLFLGYYLNSDFVNQQKTQSGQGHSVVHLYGKNVEDIDIVIPPITEQQKIASILSKWDEVIENQVQFIVAKQKQKKGLMHKLLTCEVRFPGFEEKWENLLLPQVSWYQEGPGLRKWQFRETGIKVINITNIVDGQIDLSKTERYISQEEFEKTYSHFLIDINDIVVASSGNSYCKHGIVKEKDLPLLMNTSVIRFKPLKNCDYNFLNQFLKSSLFKNQIDTFITGGAQPNFGPAHLAEVKIPFPTFNEQHKIGKFLEAFDLEITLLKRRLEALQIQRKGLMQVLLTGKMRVKF